LIFVIIGSEIGLDGSLYSIEEKPLEQSFDSHILSLPDAQVIALSLL
jgi:hypothetical protein